MFRPPGKNSCLQPQPWRSDLGQSFESRIEAVFQYFTYLSLLSSVVILSLVIVFRSMHIVLGLYFAFKFHMNIIFHIYVYKFSIIYTYTSI